LNIIWNYIEPWIDRQKFAFTTFSVLAGCWFLYITITKNKVTSSSDLLSISGTMSRYSFIDGEKGTKRYYILLNEYPQTFQIPAEFLSFFAKEKFESDMQKGQELSLRISKFDEKKLGEPYSYIFIYELNKGSSSFLNSELTIKQENSYLFYYWGTGFIIAGLGFYLFKKRQLRRNQQV
jgi:hypothetical protein